MYKEILLEFRIFKNGLNRLVTPLFVVKPLLFLFKKLPPNGTFCVARTRTACAGSSSHE